ncbi:hypothetical protein BKA56DRAFT_569007, partial [Ilyonectria sp. MPI-CAGE-AT-0026]
ILLPLSLLRLADLEAITAPPVLMRLPKTAALWLPQLFHHALMLASHLRLQRSAALSTTIPASARMQPRLVFRSFSSPA